jgi:hypothetical protein
MLGGQGPRISGQSTSQDRLQWSTRACVEHAMIMGPRGGHSLLLLRTIGSIRQNMTHRTLVWKQRMKKAQVITRGMRAS